MVLTEKEKEKINRLKMKVKNKLTKKQNKTKE